MSISRTRQKTDLHLRAQKLAERLLSAGNQVDLSTRVPQDDSDAREFLLAKRELMELLKARYASRREQAEALAHRLDAEAATD